MAKKIVPPILKTGKPLSAGIRLMFAFAIIIYATVFLSRQANIVTADLGRHITNGKIFAETGKIISTNYYSYTETDFPTINHHWGSGVIFYFIHHHLGFEGLTVFYVLVVLGALLFFLAVAAKYADARLVFFIAVLSMPFIASRTEVRPEGISFLFTGLFFYVLVLFREHKLSLVSTLIILGIAQLLWVNIHIYFFMGFMLAGFFLVEEYLNGKNLMRIKQYLIMQTALILASLINPSFIEGLLEPFTIFREFGYTASENKSILFMQEKFNIPLYIHVELQLGLMFVLMLPLLINNKFKKNLFLLFPLLAFGLLAFMAVRAIPLFGLACVPAGAFMIQHFGINAKTGIKKNTLNFLALIAAGVICIGFLSGYSTFKKNNRPGTIYSEPFYFSPFKYTTGIGLYPGLESSAMFFLKNNIKGPIFNDYDIGGYLIYYLYGRERVFVDNRPEAYSVSFFQDVYIPMQENMELFRKEEQKYHFNCIWFYRHEDSPWSQHFLAKMIRQPDYAPVFVDELTIMFLKRNRQNDEIIKMNEVPKSKFGFAPKSL